MARRRTPNGARVMHQPSLIFGLAAIGLLSCGGPGRRIEPGTGGTSAGSAGRPGCRRAEVAAQAQQYELGPKPDKPASVSGSFSGNTITVTVSDAGKTISFPATISYPTTGTAPYPAMIGIGGISLGAAQLNAMGVATIMFPNDSIAAQVNASSRGQGLFYNLYTTANPAGAMIAWAWGVSRLI